MSALKKSIKVFCAVLFLTISFSVTSHAAILLFKGKGFFLMNMVFDSSNLIVNPTGSGQPYLNNTSFLKFNLYPTLEDKNFKTAMKFKVNPNSASGDYILVDGFNFIYNTDTANITLFVNRFGFRFNDPMFSGLENYFWEYSKYGYDRPVYFSYNNSIQTPAFYDGKTRDDFLRLGYGLVGLYIAGKGTMGYEIAAYVNKWQASSHIQADINFDLDMLKFGAIVRIDDHPNNDSAKAAAYNMTNIHSPLSQKYNNAFVTYSAGLFGNVNLMDFAKVFIEGIYRTGAGIPGTFASNRQSGVLDIYGGVGSDMFPGTDLEVAVLYRMDMFTNNSRIDISIKDFNNLDFEVFQLYLLASVNIMSGKSLGVDISGLAANLSGRVSIFDLFGVRLAGSYESYTQSTNTASDLTIKATVDFYIDETLSVYAGITMYNLLSDFSGRPFYESSYMLPVCGLISQPFETLRMVLAFGYDIQTFEYDYDGANMENMITKKQGTVLAGVTKVYASEWMKYVANPSITFIAAISF